VRLENKIAVVTGGGSGIGLGICQAFVRQGAKVAVVDMDGAKADAAARLIADGKPGTAIGVTADVTDPDAVTAMADTVIDAFGRVDVLVNNAGARCIKSFLDHDLDDWNRMIGINLTGPFLCSRALVPYMIGQGSGAVIHLASIASFMGRPDRVAYVAAKTGVLGLTRAMAVDLGGTGVRVNAIAPGMIATPFNAMFADDPETGPRWARENCVGRWGTPEDIANAAVFLASDESAFMTGADIKVDGGWLAAKIRGGEDADKSVPAGSITSAVGGD